VNPIDANATSITITIDEALVITDVNNIVQADYTVGDITSPTNNAPVANDDTAVTDEDTSVTIDVLSNDTDLEIDATSAAIKQAEADAAAETAVATQTEATAAATVAVAASDTATTLQTEADAVAVTAVTIQTEADIAAVTAATIQTEADVAQAVVDAMIATADPAVISMDDQLIQVRNMEAITKAQASINEYGTDYTGGDTDTLIKYEMWIDATNLSALDASATEIFGYQFDMDVDAAVIGALDFSMIAGENFGFNADNPENSVISFHSTLGGVAWASAYAIVDNDVSNDGPPYFIGLDKLVGTFYVNPIDANTTSADITINSMLVVTDVGNIIQDDYTIAYDIT
jgi:hypothetical protein